MLPLTLSVTPCSSRDFMQKLAWLVPFLTGSHHTCHVGHNSSLKVMLFQWKTPRLVCGVPQGSVLDRYFFFLCFLFVSLYTRQLAELINKFCIEYHFLLLLLTIPSCTPVTLRNIESCCMPIKTWMMKNKLKLNGRKQTYKTYQQQQQQQNVDHHLGEKLSLMGEREKKI